MAEVIRYVDPDVAEAGNGTSWEAAYASLSAWEAAENTNLVTAGNWHHVYVRSSGGTADTTAVVIAGWTTDATHYILLEAASTDRVVKTGWDTARYRLEVTDGTCIASQVDFLRIDGLQIRTIYSEVAAKLGILITTVVDPSDIRVSNCRLRGADNTSASDRGIEVSDAQATVSLWNNIIYEFDQFGIKITSAAAAKISNCIVYDCSTDGGEDGIAIAMAGTITNCVSFNNQDDLANTGSATVNNLASDDGDGTNPVAPSGGDWANEFVSHTTGDYTILSTGNLYQGGIDDSIATDIDGDAYHATTPSIGVDEYVAAGGDIVVLRRRRM